MENIEHVPGPDGDNNMPRLIDDDEDEYIDRSVHIKHGIAPKDLVDKDGVSFEVDPAQFNVDDLEVSVEDAPKPPRGQYFEPDEWVNEMNAMTQFPNDYEDEDGETITPFERLSRKMSAVTSDQKVKKELVRPGIGGVVPPDSVVRVHYSGRLEYADEPFDSSYLQQGGRPKTFKLGDGTMLPGLDVAVGTMKKDEISQFLIHYDYFMGDLGCPPRVPPKATVLFRVELISFTDRAEVADYFSMPRSERKEADIDIILKVIDIEKRDGKECFDAKNYHGALRKYKKAIDILEEARLADHDAETKQKSQLLILYRNAANCADKVGEASRVIFYCNSALRINPRDAKAWYFKGKGLTREMEFQRATAALKKALAFSPNSKEISIALRDLNERIKKLNLEEKKMFQKMFNTDSSDKPTPAAQAEPVSDADRKKAKQDKLVKKMEEEAEDDPLSQVSDTFKQLVREELQKFLKTSDATLPFPTARHTHAEICCLVAIADEMGLQVQEVGQGGNHHYRFSKPQA